jgi:serine/threonine protein kinase/tetratricopeptide (TPR) repeat protein
MHVGAKVGHFEILCVAGRGGMGEVWKALDTKLRREVALKSLPAEFARDADRLARLEREATALASLNHPGIAAIHSLEEHGNDRFLVLEFIDGQTLYELLLGGPVPIERALKIALQIAEALEAAHEKGVIHRDLKPANVKLTPDERVKVLDFGLAKNIASSRPGGATTTALRTELGAIMGTPAYMSPEQARGEEVRKQSDLWSLGTMLYEMVTGRPAFEGATTTQTLARVIEAQPDFSLLPSGADRLRDVLTRCLEKDRKRRIQSAGDLRVALEDALAIREPMPSHPPRASPAVDAGPSIAVLPFDNISTDPEQEFFADGVVEAITATLSRIRSFMVISRNSAFRYKGQHINVPSVARELGVRYLLEGSVQRVGNRVRITVQLIDAIDDAHVWADRVDGTLEDIFELQDRITERVAGALQPSIRQAEIERARRKPPQELGAYDYAMRAMPFVWALEKEASEKALELLERAIEIDPSYALAWSLAGWCHAQRLVYNWADAIAASKAAAQRCAERAAELGSDEPLVLAVLGAVHSITRNQGTARVLLERAVMLDPNSAWAWSRLGWVENYSENPTRALENFERALRLSPLDPMNFNNYVGMGIAHEIAERYDSAVQFLQRALQERPHAFWILRSLVSALAGAGRIEEAKVARERLLAAYPKSSIAAFRSGMVFESAVMDKMTNHWRAAGIPE